jgi:hypothetical protein
MPSLFSPDLWVGLTILVIIVLSALVIRIYDQFGTARQRGICG